MSVELTDEQANVLNGAHRLMDQLLTNPKTKHVVEKAIKTIHPTVVTEADKAQPLINGIVNVNKKLDQTINYLKSKEIDSNLSSAFSKLKEDYAYTDEGIDEIKQLMVKERIPSPEAAAALYSRRNPPTSAQTPSLFSPTDWGFGHIEPNDEDAKLLWKNEDAWADKQSRKILAEIAKGTFNDKF